MTVDESGSVGGMQRAPCESIPGNQLLDISASIKPDRGVGRPVAGLLVFFGCAGQSQRRMLERKRGKIRGRRWCGQQTDRCRRKQADRQADENPKEQCKDACVRACVCASG